MVAHVTDGNVGDAFTVDDTGLMTVTGLLDFNTINTYTVTVFVLDDMVPTFPLAQIYYGPHNATVTVTINVIGELFYNEGQCLL